MIDRLSFGFLDWASERFVFVCRQTRRALFENAGFDESSWLLFVRSRWEKERLEVFVTNEFVGSTFNVNSVSECPTLLTLEWKRIDDDRLFVESDRWVDGSLFEFESNVDAKSAARFAVSTENSCALFVAQFHLNSIIRWIVVRRDKFDLSLIGNMLIFSTVDVLLLTSCQIIQCRLSDNVALFANGNDSCREKSIRFESINSSEFSFSIRRPKLSVDWEIFLDFHIDLDERQRISRLSSENECLFDGISISVDTIWLTLKLTLR